MSVRRYVYVCYISQNHASKIHQISVDVTTRLGLCLTTVQFSMLCTSGFVDYMARSSSGGFAMSFATSAFVDDVIYYDRPHGV